MAVSRMPTVQLEALSSGPQHPIEVTHHSVHLSPQRCEDRDRWIPELAGPPAMGSKFTETLSQEVRGRGD